MNQEVLHPFLKWAGGKRWLVEQHFDLLDVAHDRLIEPFLGSGAVFFRLAPERAILSDKNERLVATYQAIRDDWCKVLAHLKVHQRRHDKDYYYKIRDHKPRSAAGKAAQFIYLNRTCWNGLYRVNLKGEFNVPIGTKTNVLLDTDDFEKVSERLANVELLTGDFERAIDRAGCGDFLFIDPPYTVKHNNNGFIKYNESLFSWEDQIRLKNAVERAVLRGAKALVTNAYHESVKELYDGVGEQLKLNRASVISGKTSGRGRYEEIVIKCY